jgi:hypothetical protein
MDELLEGPAQLDGRTMADMLGYFVKFSRQVNFYDVDAGGNNLITRDWQPFFQNSLPFVIASLLNFRRDAVTAQLAAYQRKFQRRPTKQGLIILINYLITKVIKPFTGWQQQLENSGLPVSIVLDGLIKKELGGPVLGFIQYVNTAVKCHQVPAVDIASLFPLDSPWGFTADQLLGTVDSKSLGRTRRQRLIALYQKIFPITTPFFKAINASTGAAGISLQQSFEGLKDELKQRHQPHLALIFAFLNLFRHLQDGLNGYTKKHLDFFYRQVLDFQPKGATPDKAHIVFAIQKQLPDYLLKKGVTLKGPKDDKKADILFALDDELVVNQAQVTDLRTLYLNDQPVAAEPFVQGVYMAPVATKADGVDKDFPAGGPSSWPTVGSRFSKYTDPENGFVREYPNARLGLVLASPVLLLNEGARTVTIQMSCLWQGDRCPSPDGKTEDPTALYRQLAGVLGKTYYYVNQDLVKQAVKAGIDPVTEGLLRGFLVRTRSIDIDDTVLCNGKKDNSVQEPLFEATVVADQWPAFSDAVKTSLLPFFPPQQGLQLAFSGDKDWVNPRAVATITAGALTAAPGPVGPGGVAGPVDYAFTLTIVSTLQLDEPPVTFYNKDVLKEDINTVLPAVRILLNDRIKLSLATVEDDKCCLRPPDSTQVDVSLYHFFRKVVISDTCISVVAKGLKKFIVQNDESIQDVNKPVYPFGTRPMVIGFSKVTEPFRDKPPANANLIGPNYYIGSQEIFCKKWTGVRVNLNWKDKPGDFADYYRAYWAKNGKFGLDERDFQLNIAVLEKQEWLAEQSNSYNAFNCITRFWNRALFDSEADPADPVRRDYAQSIVITSADFFKQPDAAPDPCNDAQPAAPVPSDPCGFNNPAFVVPACDSKKAPGANELTQGFHIDPATPLTKWDQTTQYGFLRLNLQNQDFLHKDYAYVLARQMMALSKQTGDDKTAQDEKLENAVYYDQANEPVVFDINLVKENVVDGKDLAKKISDRTDNIIANAPAGGGDITGINADGVRTALYDPGVGHDMKSEEVELNTKLKSSADVVDTANLGQAIIPNEPWTPIIQGISLDYCATAINTDITLIHLYPFAGTYKKEELSQTPPLLPHFCDEGYLFLGLTGLVPDTNLNILFQLAEATADTEDDPTPLEWSYLDQNVWKPLRTGFEILDDATDELSTSGVLKFALPGNISTGNTVMPPALSWIRASIAGNSGIVAETIAVFTQAIRATFTNADANDKERLDQPLAAGTLTKLETADANVKKVDQPFDSFDGRVPESDGYFYVRVSETLRHKGRAIQRGDYERIALDAFPQLFKAKCINHSLGRNAHLYTDDMPLAPGYVLLAVIPDLNKLEASAGFEPRVPLSLLEALEIRMREQTSPFVRFRAMNPRYEKVDYYLQVTLLPGKDEKYYQQQLAEDIREFMAPWSVGEFDKLRFGQVINRSDVIRFLETRDYLDYVVDWRWRHDEDVDAQGKKLMLSATQPEIFPLTPRSILVAGEIDICIIKS